MVVEAVLKCDGASCARSHRCRECYSRPEREGLREDTSVVVLLCVKVQFRVVPGVGDVCFQRWRRQSHSCWLLRSFTSK